MAAMQTWLSSSDFEQLVQPSRGYYVYWNGHNHSYCKNSYVTWAPGILSRHLVNGCVLKCGCICLMLFRNLSCLDTIIWYINIIGIIPAYACNVLNVCDAFVQILQPLANVHETKWTRHVKRDCDVAVLKIAVT